MKLLLKIKTTLIMKNTFEILKQNQHLRNKCLVYTRVMGYHRPVESFNIGKKGEHRQRTYFKEVLC